jgi:iron complex transport system substrate-binding protein
MHRNCWISCSWLTSRPVCVDRCALRSTGVFALGALVLMLAPGPALGGDPGSPPGAIRRVVSLNPSLTAITLALGAGDRLVGVDDYSARIEENVAALPRVGGLFSPNLEAVVALEPDVVVVVPSVAQRDFRQRLEGLGVRVEVFENIRFDDVLENIERLGRILGREQAAAARIAAIEAARVRAREVGSQREHPSAVIVIQREPLYVVGRGSFMAEMLTMLGAANLGDAFDEAYPRAAEEWLVDVAPEVLIDMTEGGSPARAYWSRHGSLPAVRDGRVQAVPPGAVSLPGPDLDRSLAVLAGALYGEEARREVADDAANDAGAGARPVAESQAR